MEAITSATVHTSTPVSLVARTRSFRGIADPSQPAILEALREGEQGAGDIAAFTGLIPGSIHRHPACLRECGLIAAPSVGATCTSASQGGMWSTCRGMMTCCSSGLAMAALGDSSAPVGRGPTLLGDEDGEVRRDAS